MQTKLPEDFVRLMHEHYDRATADGLLEALTTTEPEVSVRLNPRKLSAEELLSHRPGLEPVPWCPGAFYLPERPVFTFDPLLHAGAYYVQEASSMYVAKVLREALDIDVGDDCGQGAPDAQNPTLQTRHEASLQASDSTPGFFNPPLLALDLCAAPGGKSTLLQSLLPEGSLLISNEVVAKRAQILSENIQKWMKGQPPQAPRVVVTQNRPSDFGRLAGRVDVLLTDVPCSGEGMFRKDDVAVQEWSLGNVEMCRQRQREILGDIWPALKPGGLLIYSTCTFNRYEDEDNVRWLCHETGATLLCERHFLPGRDRGEGFYVAALRAPKPSAGEDSARGLSEKDWQVGRFGLHILPPEQAMPTASEEDSDPHIELTYDQALQYLRREALRIDAPRGPLTLCYRGLILGKGKGVGSRINNLYPEAWRIRTTYTQPFSLLERVENVQQNAPF